MSMGKLELKKKLIDECLDIQHKIVENLQNVMDEAQQGANEYGQPKDRYDSYRAQLLNQRDLFGGQLEKAANEIKVIKKIDLSRAKEYVSFGAIIITKEQKLFVSISAGKIQIDDEIYFAISPMAPIYQTINKLTKGDTFVFRGKQDEIIDVF